MTERALEGLRILDLTQIAAGPYATLLLGFMGAEVIKVESCARMDINRGPARPTPENHRLYPHGEPGERPWNRTAHHVGELLGLSAQEIAALEAEGIIGTRPAGAE